MRARVLPLPARSRPIAVPRNDPRKTVCRALSRCAARDRVLLALLLFERLTPAEAATVLGIPVSRIERAYLALLRDLRATVGRPRTRTQVLIGPGAPRFSTPAAGLRRAS
jgi:DNA-directed RNA polymerase specialized sigma24 family protein